MKWIVFALFIAWPLWIGAQEPWGDQTDDPQLDVKATSALLEAFYSQFDETWTGRVCFGPWCRRVRCL